MKIINKALEELRPYENNPRDNAKGVDPVAESIKAYGFLVPLVIDKDGVIVAGHTRYLAAQKLGLKAVPCVVASDLNETQIRAFRLADNKTADFSIWDNKKLLEELDALGDDLFTGFFTSDVFTDILDVKDNSVLDENTAGVKYRLIIESADEEKIQECADYARKLLLI